MNDQSTGEVPVLPSHTTENFENTLIVDYDLSPDEMITAGKYDAVDKRIKGDLFIKRDEIKNPETMMFVFGDNTNAETARKCIRAWTSEFGISGGWEPARAEHLLTYGSGKFSQNYQRHYPIVASGTICEIRGKKYQLVLSNAGSGLMRTLELSPYDAVFVPKVRHLAIRIKK